MDVLMWGFLFLLYSGMKLQTFVLTAVKGKHPADLKLKLEKVNLGISHLD